MSPREDGVDVPVEGVTALDHTADVGLEVVAPDLGELIRRAVLGMDWLLRESGPPQVSAVRRLGARGEDAAALLRAVLREVLLWHELDGFAPADVDVEVALPTHAQVRVRGGVPAAPPVREIKGVTLHGLAARRRDGGWWGRVVFDV